MRSRLAIVATVVAVVAGGLSAVGPAPTANALSAGMPVSADALPTWQTNAQVFGLAASNGRMVVGGAFTQLRPGSGQTGAVQNLRGLAILDMTTGQPDACQLPVSIGSGTATVYAVSPGPDATTVFVGGNFSSIGGVARSRLAEIDVRTCRVTAFNPAAISSTVQSIAVAADGVYVGGLFQTVGGQPRRSFAKLTRAGALLPWIANASGATVDPYSTTVSPDANSRGTAITLSPTADRVVIGGNFFSVNGQSSHSFAVVSATDGSVLRTWPASTVGNTSRTKALVSDATRFYVGNEGFNGFDGSLAYNWSDYSQAWRDSCAGATQAMALRSGTLIEAHHHHDCTGQGMFPDGRRTYLSASRADDPTQQHLGWLPELNDGTGEGLGPRALAFGTSASGVEQLWVGGEFTRVNGTNQQGLTRFSAVDTGAPPTPTIAGRSISPGAIQVNIRGVVDPDDSDLTYAVYRGTNTTTPVWTGVARSQHWYRNQTTFVDTAVTPGTAYAYRVRAIDAAGNQSALSASVTVTASPTGSAYASSVLADSPRLYWRYDDTANAQWVVDSSGQTVQGLNGLAQNGVVRSGAGALIGDTSRSATFSESGALPQYIWNDVIARGPTTYSIETWVRTTSTTGGALVNYGSSNGRPRSDDGTDRVSSTVDRVIYMESGSGFVRFGVRGGSGTNTLRTSTQLNDGQWHHVVATQSSAGMRLYVDGALHAQNSSTSSGTYFGTWHAGGDNLSGYPGGGTSQAARYFDGQLDETAVYYSVLPAERVSAHHAAGTAIGGDLTPPSAPGSVTTSVVADTVTVSWTPSVDDVAVTSYEIHRSTTAGFTPGPTTVLSASVASTSYTDSNVAVGTWHYRVLARDAAGNRSSPSGSVPAVVTPPDTTPPTVPAGVSATTQGGDALLSWGASTDANAVTGYAVHRGATPDLAATPDSRIATVSTPGFTDASVGAGTWYYLVTAFDAAGNTSAASSTVSLVIDPPPPATTVQTIVADADTMAAAVNPAFVYGTSNQISSRFDTAIESFLRFTLPPAPPGTVLAGATLSVRTSSDSTAASGDVHDVRIVDAPWDEGTLTWNNRPTTGIGTTAVGQLVGASALNTPYVIALEVGQLAPRAASAVTLRISSPAGVDNVRLLSRESTSAGSRPTLTLTYTAP